MRRYLALPCCLLAILSACQILQYLLTTQILAVFSSYKFFPSSFNFIINEENLCAEKNGAGVELLVAVFLGPNDTYERDFIRSTWGAVAKTHPKMRLFFILGSSPNSSSTTHNLKNESLRYRDIIQCDFEDKYKNLVNKSFAVFQWTIRYCDSVQYVLKIDSDMRIELPPLLSALERPGVPNELLCGTTIYREQFVTRKKNHKCYVSKEEYPNAKYPDFCQGAAYVIPRRIVGKFATYRIPERLFPMDDVYITGILRKQLNVSIYEGFLKYLHHHEKTETRLKNGRYIMNVTTRGHKNRIGRKL